MIDLLRIAYYVEHLAWIVALASATVVILTSFFGALARAKPTKDRPAVAISPLVTVLLASLSTGFVIIQVEAYAVVIQRLGQLSGAFDAVAHTHAVLFVCLITLTTARAFLVITEMDAGRYAGRKDVPLEIVKGKRIRVLESFIRIGIVILLAIFASSFLKIHIPLGSPFDAEFGAPEVLVASVDRCSEYEATVHEYGFRRGANDCLLETLSDLSELDQVAVAKAIVTPLNPLLLLTYGAMVAWCVVVWFAAQRTIKNRGWLRKALTGQIAIAIVSAISVIIMLCWVDIASSQSAPFLLAEESRESTAQTLFWISVIGCIIIVLANVLILLRTGSDLKILFRLAGHWRSERAEGECR